MPTPDAVIRASEQLLIKVGQHARVFQDSRQYFYIEKVNQKPLQKDIASLRQKIEQCKHFRTLSMVPKLDKGAQTLEACVPHAHSDDCVLCVVSGMTVE